MTRAITIIIPTFNSGKYIKKCLDSIFSQTYKNFEVIIFDNGSCDDTFHVADQYPVTLVKNGYNVGWARANNLCIAKAKSRYVFLLNIDTVLHKDCLKKLFEFAESKNNFACISPGIVEYLSSFSGKHDDVYPLAFDINSGLIKAYSVDQEYVEVSFVPGTALFANRCALKKELYFREDFFMYHEDVEFSLRILARTSFKLFFLKTAIIAHDSKQSFSKPSTCSLALRNLFKCLIEYQNCKEFLSHYYAYAKSLFLMYIRFYGRYYPITYPIFSAYHLLVSLARLQRCNDMDLTR
ncbi:MAG: glycosyltransferase family 2 protein, partial [Candidatus Jorgensenbacteria bacterium]